MAKTISLQAFKIELNLWFLFGKLMVHLYVPICLYCGNLRSGWMWCHTYMMTFGKFCRSGERKVAIKSIGSSFCNISDEHKTSELFREPIALVVSAISKRPFSNEAHDKIGLTLAICNGERPQTNRKMFIPDCYKELMEQCWHNVPSNRPNINELYEILRGWYLAGINDNQFEDANSKNKNIEFIHLPEQQVWENSEFISTHITNDIP
ncbi:12016_t:CDS:2, partial [Cetraspora pellucida]